MLAGKSKLKLLGFIEHSDLSFCTHEYEHASNKMWFVNKSRVVCVCVLKVGISGYGNLQTTSTASKSTQLSTKVWVKLLLLLENDLTLNF